jgi:hypothetical protein
MERNARLARRRWRARHKTRRRRAARAGWHGFDEYAFLEDSRYASQRENVGHKRVLAMRDGSVSGAPQSPIFFMQGDYRLRWPRSRVRLSV